VFHGDGGDAVGLHEAWPFERATGGGAFVVYPEGIGRTWNLEALDENPDEAYVVAIVEALAEERPIDRSRIFAAGYSSGGFLANVLACHRPGLFRAIASNAGGAPYGQREKWPNGYPKCPGQAPVAMLALHGERDWTVGLDSGRFSAEYWAYVNRCRADELETTGYPECQIYRGCPTGKAVGWCSVESLGHWVWSASAEASWTFFETSSR
jgi:polyhydroxybutyrate depolymerase